MHQVGPLLGSAASFLHVINVRQCVYTDWCKITDYTPRAARKNLCSHACIHDNGECGCVISQARKLYVDVSTSHAAVFFCGTSQPLAAVSGVSAFGALMLGRQITAPPEQQTRPMPVGASRKIMIPIAPKGSRALIKVYTDLRATVDDPRVCYGIGLEPIIALVSI